jgi:tetratricopeptide (TPR) repeat protein
VKNAQGAFARQDYEHAVTLAQAALREDPGNAAAQKILDNAHAGQAAAAQFRAAEAAIARGELTLAASQIEAARAGAPWDSRASGLQQQLEDAQRAQRESQQKAQQESQAARAQQQQAAQLNELLSRADGALTEQRYDAAIELYNQALSLEPQNQRASVGRTGALSARALAQAAQAAPVKAAKGFVLGATQARGAEAASAGGGAPGFEESATVTVKKGTQAANLPGKINIDVDPASVKPGDSYIVRISIRNEGDAPIQVQELIVKTTVDGHASSGPLQPLVKDVAPQQKAMLREVKGQWKEDTTSWRMEVTVKTARGETYTNEVTWR